MKILQVVNSFKDAWSSGGVARAAYDLSVGLTKRGHTVTVFTTDKDLTSSNIIKKNRPVAVDGIVTYYYSNFSKVLAKVGIAIPVHAYLDICNRKKDFDIIHIHETRRIMNVLVYFYARKYKIPYIFQAHGSLPTNKAFLKRILGQLLDHLFTRRFLRDAAKVIALTPVEADQYRLAGVCAEKITIIPNGIDLSAFATLPQKGLFKRKVGISANDEIVLYLGRINKIKGVDYLVKAFAEVSKHVKNVSLVIVGPDDGFLNNIKDAIKTLNISDKVLIIGPLYGQAKLAAYVDASVYVLPSRYEIFGITILESIACGTPVVLMENCGIANLFAKKVGTIVEEPSDLQQAIFQLLTDKFKIAEYKKNCEKLIKTFDITKSISEVENTYFSTIKNT
jgi:glycosyltransferase involved in cell wall biosynthesis